jgi:hypothetical protein
MELSGNFYVVCARSGRDASTKLSNAGSSVAQAFDASSRMLKGALLCYVLRQHPAAVVMFFTDRSVGASYLDAGGRGSYGIGYASQPPLPSAQLALPAPPAPDSPASFDVSHIWSSQLQEHLKVPGTFPGLTSPSPFVLAGALQPGMLDERQVEAALALARAKNAVATAATKSYPSHLHAHV